MQGRFEVTGEGRGLNWSLKYVGELLRIVWLHSSHLEVSVLGEEPVVLAFIFWVFRTSGFCLCNLKTGYLVMGLTSDLFTSGSPSVLQLRAYCCELMSSETVFFLSSTSKPEYFVFFIIPTSLFSLNVGIMGEVFLFFYLLFVCGGEGVGGR